MKMATPATTRGLQTIASGSSGTSGVCEPSSPASGSCRRGSTSRRCSAVPCRRSLTLTMRVAEASWTARVHQGALAARKATSAVASARRRPRARANR